MAVINGSSGSDWYLFGTTGNDSISGYGGDDQLLGGRGNDTLLGGSGWDVLDGVASNSLLLSTSTLEERNASRDARDILDCGVDRGCDTVYLGDVDSYYMGNGFATIRNFNINDDMIVVARNVDYNSNRITLRTDNVTGTGAADTIIQLDGNTIGVIEDQNLVNAINADRDNVFWRFM